VWMSPACGPLSTVAMPEICPRSLILLAMSDGGTLRVVITRAAITAMEGTRGFHIVERGLNLT
jgi:hypothetical protein